MLNDSHLFRKLFLIFFIPGHSGGAKTLSAAHKKRKNATGNGKNSQKRHFSLDNSKLSAIFAQKTPEMSALINNKPPRRTRKARSYIVPISFLYRSYIKI